MLCELSTPYWEKLEPRIQGIKNPDGSFSKSLFEDLSPHLTREELHDNTLLWKPKK